MYKYKKTTLNIITFLYILCFIFELIAYLKIDSTLFGVFYLIINLFIIFLLIPVTYNYKKYFSKARISKLILIIIFSIFNNFILQYIVVNSMPYIDSSLLYIKSIFLYKNVIKLIITVLLIIFTMLEYRLDDLISKRI